MEGPRLQTLAFCKSESENGCKSCQIKSSKSTQPPAVQRKNEESGQHWPKWNHDSRNTELSVSLDGPAAARHSQAHGMKMGVGSITLHATRVHAVAYLYGCTGGP